MGGECGEMKKGVTCCLKIRLPVVVGADTEFLIYALNMSKSNVYSLHKSSTVQVMFNLLVVVVGSPYCDFQLVVVGSPYCDFQLVVVVFLHLCECDFQFFISPVRHITRLPEAGAEPKK